MDMYDYVIVGAGFAGCVLANRVSEDPDVNVLVIEAGGPDANDLIHIPAAFPALFRTQQDWDLSTGYKSRCNKPSDSGEDIESHVRAHAQTQNHPVGSCRMGVDELAVVGSRAARARRRGAARGGRFDHAGDTAGEHERPDDRDRREGG
jgi:choline dehydrogenase-like flavoprotein